MIVIDTLRLAGSLEGSRPALYLIDSRGQIAGASEGDEITRRIWTTEVETTPANPDPAADWIDNPLSPLTQAIQALLPANTPLAAIYADAMEFIEKTLHWGRDGLNTTFENNTFTVYARSNIQRAEAQRAPRPRTRAARIDVWI